MIAVTAVILLMVIISWLVFYAFVTKYATKTFGNILLTFVLLGITINFCFLIKPLTVLELV